MVDSLNTADKAPMELGKDLKKESREAMRSIVLKWIADESIGKGEQAIKEIKTPPIKESASEPVIDISPTIEVSNEQKETVLKALEPKIALTKETVLSDALANAPDNAISENNVVDYWPSAESVVQIAKNGGLSPSEFYEQPSFVHVKKRMSLWGRLYLMIWLLFIFGFATFAVGVYKFGWNDETANKILRYVPLPYGFVRYHPIWYGVYRQEYQAISLFRSQQADSTNASISPEEIEQILIRRAIANDLALSHGVWVTNQEVANEFNNIVANAGSEEKVQRAVQLFWGYNIDEYKQLVIRSFLIKKKLIELLAKDDPTFASKLTTTNLSNNLQALEAYLDKLGELTPVVLFR